jgi:hypothetical protein
MEVMDSEVGGVAFDGVITLSIFLSGTRRRLGGLVLFRKKPPKISMLSPCDQLTKKESVSLFCFYCVLNFVVF